MVTGAGCTWSVCCSACGRCCNSSPLLSVPELFRHQHAFVGSLAIRRVRRLKEGDRFGAGVVSAAASAAQAALAEQLLHRPEHADAPFDFWLAVQGVDYPSVARCPALGDDRRCTLHHDRKPATCSVVPLEALVPDSLQHLVLAGRDADGHRGGCIAAGERAGWAVATRGGAVTDPELRQALARCRGDLAADKRWWGDAVFRMLRDELCADPVAVTRIPFDGFLAIAPVPLLAVLAEVSERCRARCIEYLDAQSCLIEERIRLASGRDLPEDRPVTRQLRAFADVGQVLRRTLAAAPRVDARRSPHADEVEAWLGLEPCPTASAAHRERGDRAEVSGLVSAAAARLKISPEAVQTWLGAGRGEGAPGVERRLHATVKPGGSACNLDCTYCYYLGKDTLLGQDRGCIRDDLLERFIADYIASQDGEEIPFTWHGGEPTLLGIDFFRRVVELQARHTPPGRRVVNDLQTNGTLLDDDWCAFLAEHGFLVGLSMDGPRELHDACRRTRKGASCFDDVLAAAGRLRRYGITFSTLTTVNRYNAGHPLSVYRFLRDEVGAAYMQFIPCVEPRQFRKVPPGYVVAEPGSRGGKAVGPLMAVTEWSVGSLAWGDFLARVFDEWHDRDRGRVRVNLFESLLAQLEGRPALVCTSSPFCGKNVAVEHDGRVYACDHYVYPEYEIGTLAEQSLGAMVFSLKQLEFGLAKYSTLPGECRACRYLKLCWGECPRTRILPTQPGEGRLSYLCRGWQRFFDHALKQLSRSRG